MGNEGIPGLLLGGNPDEAEAGGETWEGLGSSRLERYVFVSGVGTRSLVVETFCVRKTGWRTGDYDSWRIEVCLGDGDLFIWGLQSESTPNSRLISAGFGFLRQPFPPVYAHYNTFALQ